jgi:hypothetical protein
MNCLGSVSVSLSSRLIYEIGGLDEAENEMARRDMSSTQDAESISTAQNLVYGNTVLFLERQMFQLERVDAFEDEW